MEVSHAMGPIALDKGKAPCRRMTDKELEIGKELSRSRRANPPTWPKKHRRWSPEQVLQESTLLAQEFIIRTTSQRGAIP